MIRKFLEGFGHLVAGTLFAAALIALTAIMAGCQPAESQLPGDVVTWVIPTQREDGTPLPAAEYKATRIQWGTSSTGPFNLGQQTVTGTATTVTIPRTGYGQRCYSAVAIDTGDRVSAPSNVACKTVTAPPKAPTLTVS